MRLSSKKAKSVLEFMCKKKLGADSCIARLHLYSHINNYVRYYVLFDIEFSDGKGCVKPLLEKHKLSFGFGPMLLLKQFSWSKILRCIEDRSQHGSSFSILERDVFNSSDTIEKKIVEMDLENEL